MKTLCLFVIASLIFIHSHSRAQTVYISGTFAGVEPYSNYTYKAQIGGLTPVLSALECVWELDGLAPGASPSLSTGPTYSAKNGQISNVQWENTPGSSDPKWIKVTVYYRKNGDDQTPLIYQTPISVKHISIPGPLNIAGSNYSHNSTFFLNCGVTNLPVSFPAVTTSDPVSAVTYTWTYPPGWNGPITTTTPSANISSHQSNPGKIRVEAKRNDGTSKTFISVDVTRPSPTVTGLSSSDPYWLLCNPSQKLTLSANASGNTVTDKFIWTPYDGVKVNNSNSPQTILGSVSADLTASAQGSFNVKGYSTVCGKSSTTSITRYIYYGLPALSGANQYLFEPTTNLWHCSVNPQYSANHNWTVISGDASISPTSFAAYVSSVNGGVVAVSLSNGCGSTGQQYFTIPPSGGMLMAYPNPAKEQLTLQLKNTEILELLPESITLVDELTGSEALSVPVNDIFQKKQFQDGNKLLLDVKSLRRGIYYLNIISKPNSNQKSQKIRIKLE
ncbi:hypothetical protein DYBT9623_05354 [Dyadobacter sp. CECT 9623]|uniref:Secretion system C-terminal sorting domain-containing protein n=1 Tax=Dyadobacter linearis TaxID=2823330 RepID=A0ABM8UYF9_9BACT|nr:T9SS type A sorting domain-containing protein [Dyadobacter sp. CECT 9623]CAG5074667.1 hypothetical protein DYBT9623_05354 [Dyadobacter sp. CECT 9623]